MAVTRRLSFDIGPVYNKCGGEDITKRIRHILEKNDAGEWRSICRGSKGYKVSRTWINGADCVRCKIEARRRHPNGFIDLPHVFK